ncbi:hypothetical protein [Paraeggerthella sp.]|uniref:hypothetical protein n=1 Tax=Paraeggerthella sp. TaxID=2897350 RepID=UPI00352912A8
MTKSHTSTTISAGFVSSEGFDPETRRTMQATIAMQNASPCDVGGEGQKVQVVIPFCYIKPQVNLSCIGNGGHCHNGHAHVHPQVSKLDARPAPP